MSHGRSTEHELKTSQNEIDFQRNENIRRADDLKNEQDQRYSALTDASQKQYEEMKVNAEESSRQANQHFQESYKKTLELHDESLKNIQTKVGETLRELRGSTAQKLAAYSNRQKDPFYKLVDLDADLSETSDAFILRATVPLHEQESIAVTVRGDQVVVSGRRRNEEKLEIEPGHELVTAAYQSFSESYPLDWPVEARGLSRNFEGDQLIVTIPKKNSHQEWIQKQKPHAEPTRAERPEFPENLPIPRPTKPKPTLT